MSKIFSRFNLQFTCVKNIFTYLFFFLITKILTDFRKTVETGMDPRLLQYLLQLNRLYRNLISRDLYLSCE